MAISCSAQIYLDMSNEFILSNDMILHEGDEMTALKIDLGSPGYKTRALASIERVSQLLSSLDSYYGALRDITLHKLHPQ